MQPSPFARLKNQPAGRGTTTNERSRGRGRGRGRGRAQGGISPSPAPSDGSNTFQQSRGNVQRAGLGGVTLGVRGRGTRGSARGGNVSKSFNSPSSIQSSSSQPNEVLPPPIHPRPEDIRETNHEAISARRTKLHAQYEQYQKRAIQQKLMSDPDKREKLENAIFTKGTCTHMCDEKERVDRIFELQLDRAEMLPHPETGQLVPIEGRMVKRFRRSAAGVGKQIPEELRTPRTLQKTMDYLINNIVGPNPRLAQHHKFVWDRTRAIRNDCSIQSFTQPEDVKLEVDCYERIARFHILSSHLLSKPDALQHGEDFVHKQEIEQLTKTFQTLMDKYDGFGDALDFPHEAEFRAYFILFAPMTTIADLDDQVQRWPRHILGDGRVQTALKLRAAAESDDQPVGSRRFEPVPCFIAQKNAGLYWDLLRSQRVGYLMACVAEMSFRNVRFAALDSLWRTGKNAPEKGQAAMRSWSKAAVREYLGFDDDEQVEEFCSKFGVEFAGNSSTGQEYLNFKSHGAPSLDYASLGQDQVFSQNIVEQKRYGRTLVAVLNGMSIAEATKEGMITDEPTTNLTKSSGKSNMFLSQDAEDDEDEEDEEEPTKADTGRSFGSLNPQANAFTPGFSKPSTEATGAQPSWMTQFGQARPSASVFTGASPNNIFGGQDKAVSSIVPATSAQQSPFQDLGTVQSSAQSTPATVDASSSSKATGTGVPSSAFQQTPFNNSNPFAAPPAQTPSGSFIFAKPEKAPSPPKEDQIASTTEATPAFSWFNPGTAPVATPAQTPTSLPSAFPAPQPSETPKVTSAFSFKPTSATPSLPQPSNFTSPLNASNAHTQPINNPPTAEQRPIFPGLGQPTQPVSANPTPSTDASAATSATEAIATPQSTAKAPSFGTLKFPPVFKPIPEPSSTTPIGSPIRSTGFDLGAKSSPLQPFTDQATTKPDPPLSVISEREPTPQRKPIDKDQLIEHLCRIGLTQKDGILDMFVAAKVNSLCHGIFQAFQNHRFDLKISILKKAHLKRKFFALWRSRVNSKRLQKRAEKRKRMFAASIKAQQEKEKRRREEVATLAEIMESEKNKRKIQEEQRRREEEKTKRQLAEIERLQSQKAAAQTTNLTQTAGQKRKMLVSKASRGNLQDIAMSPMHKRSRTLGSGTSNVGALDTSSRTKPITHMPPASSLRRSLSHRSLQQSVMQQGIDQTESDYFRLKGLGVDPNTPLIPDTAASLAAKQKKEAEHREWVLSKMKVRPTSSFNKSTTEEVVNLTKLTASRSLPHFTTSSQSPSRPSPSVVDESEDPFLRQLREARQAMSTDAEWLKSQAMKIEQEIEEQEELRRSIGSNSGAEQSFTQSVDGLSRSISGYDYVPPQLKPGQTLSRTEQRIRATGARGLANLPIGGLPRSSSQYTPVAMSRRSASQLQSGRVASHTSSHSNRSKRSIDEVDARNGSTTSSKYNESSTRQHPQHAIKKPRHELSQSSPARMSIRALDALGPSHDQGRNGYADNSSDDGATEEDETGDELQYVGQTQNGDVRYEYEDEVDEDEDEDEEENYSGDLDDNEELEDAEGDDYSDGDDEENQAPKLRPSPLHYGLANANAEGEEDEGEGYDEEDEEEVQPGGYQNSQYMSVPSAHGSRAVSASAGIATPDTGLGSTVEEAIELSD